MLRRIVIKAGLLFIAFNVIYVLLQPLTALNRISVYNHLVPGRSRLAFSEFPALSYSLSVTNLDQLLASHEIARPKAADEYRVVMIGDSSVWGYLLSADQSQAACLNRLNLTAPDGKHIRVYNLGHPTLTAMKDYLILRHALDYQPDLILWPITLASLYPVDQLGFPVVRANRAEVLAVASTYSLNLPRLNDDLPAPAWDSSTFWGQRDQIATWLRYQAAGLGWAGTGIDYVLARTSAPHAVNLIPDDNLKSVNVVSLKQDKRFTEADLSLDIVSAAIGEVKARGSRLLLINEPIFRAENNPQRYNSYYPRWAYDSYREALRDYAARNNIPYSDFWDVVKTDQFTDTEFHLNAAANCDYAGQYLAPLLTAAK